MDVQRFQRRHLAKIVTGSGLFLICLLVANLPILVALTGWPAGWVVMLASVASLGAALVIVARVAILQRRRLLLAEQRAGESAELVRREIDRQHAGKLEAVGRLTAAIAHDFNNHLQTIISSLEIISADYLVDAESREIAQLAHAAAEKGAKLTQRLLTFSRQQVLQPSRVSVAFLLGDLCKLVADARLFEADIRCKITVEPFTHDLHVDAVQVEGCLLNLLLNARDAMPNGGTLHLEGRNAGPEHSLFGSLTPGEYVILTVRDTGRGMDEATRARAFEPFFTTKAFGSGAGLGLSMALGFCNQSGGDIRIQASHGKPGTTVEVWLPAKPAETSADDEAQRNYATIGRRTGRILLIEDQPDVLVTLSTILASGGFEVVSVNSGSEGLIRLHDRAPCDAVVTDQVMRDMTGAEFVTRAAIDVPALPMLILSGGQFDEVALATLPPCVRLLHKPIGRLELLKAVREAIGDRRSLLVG